MSAQRLMESHSPFLSTVLREIRLKIDGRRDQSSTGHAYHGRLLWAYLAQPEPEPHLAGPIRTRPLLVVYHTGTSTILYQAAGPDCLGKE